jgi:hypothetical protein
LLLIISSTPGPDPYKGTDDGGGVGVNAGGSIVEYCCCRAAVVGSLTSFEGVAVSDE